MKMYQVLNETDDVIITTPYWNQAEMHLEEGNHVITFYTCRECSEQGEMRYDAHGLPTGYWCEEHYNSSKYPYRKDLYPTIETHGYGERMDDDY